MRKERRRNRIANTLSAGVGALAQFGNAMGFGGNRAHNP